MQQIKSNSLNLQLRNRNIENLPGKWESTKKKGIYQKIRESTRKIGTYQEDRNLPGR